MGLDMYLTAIRYFGEYNDEKNIRTAVKKLLPEIFDSGNLNFMEIKFEAGYWRKANHIHRWFVENCQNGEDKCLPTEVSREQLEHLKLCCETVLKNHEKAKDVLPTQEGFFFGDTAYDELYFDDLKHTIKVIEKCLKLPTEWYFEYRSSW